MQTAAAASDDEIRTATLPDQGEHTSGGHSQVTTPADVPDPGDVEQFLSLISHELSTPMAVIASAADTLQTVLERDDVDHAELEQIADVIGRHSRLSARLLARLSLVHDIGQGSVELVTEELDLALLIEEMVSDVAAFVLPERAVTVTADGPVMAEVDRASISEILFNLLANAHKYSHEDASIEVHVGRHDEFARVVVRDQGSGVSPGDTEAIFQQYVQPGPRRGGVGLGLYVSRGLARAHGGELSVRPAADEGSEFVLELPIDAA